MSEAQRTASSAMAEAAAEWVVLLHRQDASLEDRQAFMDWLRQSPVHVREYLQAETVFLALEGVARDDARDVQSLLRSASGNVVEFPEAGSTAGRGARARASMRYLVPAVAAMLLLAIGVQRAPHLFERLNPNIYATGIGEQRHIVLADGSFIDLNTRSKVRVELGERFRNVYLAEGEAFFTVAKDSSRPFRVLSDTAVVRAIGTQFNVHRKEHATEIVVMEGRVAVARDATHIASSSAAGASGSTAPMPAGALPSSTETAKQTGNAVSDIVEVGAGGFVQVSEDRLASDTLPEPGRAVAWRQRRLIFEQDTLADVVAEFNRYNTLQVVIDDPALAGERINGVFDADKPQHLLDFLTRDATVQALELSGGRVSLSRASAPHR